jgi:hypothetical protein
MYGDPKILYWNVEHGQSYGVYKKLRSRIIFQININSWIRGFVTTTIAFSPLISRWATICAIARDFINTSELLRSIYWLEMVRRGFNSYTSSVLSRLYQRSQILWRTIRKVQSICTKQSALFNTMQARIRDKTRLTRSRESNSLVSSTATFSVDSIEFIHFTTQRLQAEESSTDDDSDCPESESDTPPDEALDFKSTLHPSSSVQVSGQPENE